MCIPGSCKHRSFSLRVLVANIGKQGMSGLHSTCLAVIILKNILLAITMVLQSYIIIYSISDPQGSLTEIGVFLQQAE